VAQTRQAVRERRLAAGPPYHVNAVWVVGPFDDGSRGFARVHPPEQGVIDLTAGYATPAGKRV
jgi:hypothetical protein